jgi:hypothetical protein
VEGGKRLQSTAWVSRYCLLLLLLLLQFVLMPVQATTTTTTATITTPTTTTTAIPWSTKSSSGTEFPIVNVTVPASSTSSLTIVLQDIPENGGTIDLTSVTFQSTKDDDEKNERTNTTTATEYSVVRQKKIATTLLLLVAVAVGGVGVVGVAVGRFSCVCAFFPSTPPTYLLALLLLSNYSIGSNCV